MKQKPSALLEQCTGDSTFAGPLDDGETGATKKCDGCGKARATWVHERIDGSGRVYLCFGCGDH